VRLGRAGVEGGQHVRWRLVADQQRETLSVAEDLHDALSPAGLPAVPGLELEVRHVAAPGGRYAGDWWDAFELPDGKLALVVGDVAGPAGWTGAIGSC
jgi:two-component system, chemotaxis family, sensor kinase Cph1